MPEGLKPKDLEKLTTELTKYAEEGATDDELRQFRDAFTSELKKKDESQLPLDGSTGPAKNSVSGTKETPKLGYGTALEAAEATEQPVDINTEIQPIKTDATQAGQTLLPIVPKGNKLIGTPKSTAEFNKKYDTDHTVEEMVTGTQAWRHPKDHPKAKEEEQDANIVKESIESAAAGLDATYAMILRMPKMLYSTFAIPQNLIAEQTGANVGIKPTGHDPLSKAADYYAEHANQVLAEQTAKYDKTISDEFNEGDKGKAIHQLANSIIQMLPPMMAMAGAGAAGAHAAAVETGGVLGFGSQKYEEIKNLDLPETTKTNNALGTGMLMSMFNKWSLDKMTLPVVQAFKTGGKEVADKVAKETFAKTYTEVFNKLAPLIDPIHSGIAFSATIFANNVLDVVTGVAPEKDLSEGVVDGFIEGMGLGLATHSAPQFLNRARKENIDLLVKTGEQLKTDMDNPDVTPESKEVILEQFKENNEKLNKEIATEKENSMKYSQADIDHINELQTTITKNKQLINDLNVSGETKATVISDNENLTKELDDFNAEVEKRKLKMYQGSDFITETGLQPGLYTNEQVKDAKKIKKEQSPIAIEPVPGEEKTEETNIHNKTTTQPAEGESTEVPETGTIQKGQLKAKVDKGKIIAPTGQGSILGSDLQEIYGSKKGVAKYNEVLNNKSLGDFSNDIVNEFVKREGAFKVGYSDASIFSPDKNSSKEMVFRVPELANDVFLNKILQDPSIVPKMDKLGELWRRVGVSKDVIQEIEKHPLTKSEYERMLIYDMLATENKNNDIETHKNTNTAEEALNQIIKERKNGWMLDLNGEPMIFMHGGRKGINEFRSPQHKNYEGSGDPLTGQEGIYFSRDIDQANKYGGFKEEGKQDASKDIYYAFLKLRNPYEIGNTEHEKQYKLKTSETINTKDRKALEDLGFDGVVWNKNDKPNHEVIVFEPDQIKTIETYSGDDLKTNKPIKIPSSEIDQLKKQLKTAKTKIRKRDIQAKINMLEKVEKIQKRENRRTSVKKSVNFEPVTESDFLEEAAYGINEKSIVDNKIFKAKEGALNEKGQPIYPDMPRASYMSGRVLKEGGRDVTDIARDLINDEASPFYGRDEAEVSQMLIDHALDYPAGVKQYLRSKKLLDETQQKSYDENARHAEEQMPDEFTDEEALDYDEFVNGVQDITQEDYDNAMKLHGDEAAAEEEFFNNIYEHGNDYNKTSGNEEKAHNKGSGKDFQKGLFEEDLDKRIYSKRKELKSAQKELADKTVEFSNRSVGDLFGKPKSEGDLFDTGDVQEETARKALKPYEDTVRSLQKELDELTDPEHRGKAVNLDKSQTSIDIKPGKSSSGDASKGPKPTIDEIVKTKTTKAEAFNYHERVKKILEKIGVPVAEKGLSKKFLGLFKHRGKNIRVQSLFNLFTATHETAHYISREFDLGKRLREKDAVSSGNSQKDLNHSLRKSLTDIYVEFYPGASKNHSLELRVEEGIAVLLERYLLDPTDISSRYKNLVDEFINPAGKYYHPKFTELLDEMNHFINDYSNLSAEEKIGSRIARGEEVLTQDTGFNAKQKAVFEMVYVGEPLRRMDEIAGAGLTQQSAEVAHFRWMDRKTIVSNWVQGNDHAMTVDRQGNWHPINASVNEYLKMITGKEKEFDSYLVARRIEGDVNYLNELLNEYSQMLAAKGPDDILTKDEIAEIDKIKEKIIRQQEIIKNDEFDIQTASDVVRTYEDKFKAPVAVFDKLNNSILDFAENTDLLTPEKAENYKENKTYASFQRLVYDDLMAEMPTGTNSQSTVSAFLGRKGSNLQIKSPVSSQIMLINETISKGMQNQIWQRLAKLGDSEVEIARRFEKMETITAVDPTGKISYPQDNDPSLIKVWKYGKRTYYKAAPELIAFAETMSPKQFETFTFLLRYASGVFSRLTTTANPLFPLVNIPVDTISAWMNTKTGFKPVWDQIKTLADMAEYSHNYILHLEKVSKWYEKIKGVKIKDLQQEDLNMFDKYLALGGKKQTQASYYEITPEELIAQTKGGTLTRKIVKGFDDYTLGLLEIPSNMSEYMTRFAEFKRAKEKGMTDDVAMYMASQVSVPFQQSGRLGGHFGTSYVKSIPYFNATLQVAAKFLRSAAENPKKVGMVTASLFTTALGMAVASMEYASDEDKRLLAEQEPQELSKYIYVPNGIFGGTGFTRIRIPEQIGAVTGLAYMNVLHGYGKTQYKMRDYIDAATVGVPNQFNITKPEQLPWAWSPQIIKPSLEITANIRSYPELSPLVPIGLENEMPEYQYTQYTSETAKLAGKLLGMSPVKIDYFVKQQFGQVPETLLNWGEAAVLDKKLKSSNRLIKQEKDFILRGRTFNDFYKYYDYWSKQNHSLEEMYKDKSKAIPELAEAHANYKRFEEMKGLLTDLRKIVQKQELNEETKELTFEILKDLNYSDKPYKAAPKIAKLSQMIHK